MGSLVSATVFQFDCFRFDGTHNCLFRLDDIGGAEPVAVGSRALHILALLIAHKGQLVSKDEIMRVVWAGMVVEESNMTVQISALRRVLDRGRANGSCIQTVPGRGYRFVSSITPIEAAVPVPTRGPDDGAADPLITDEEATLSSAFGGSADASVEPARRVRRWPKHAIIAAIAGAVFLAAAVPATIDWRLLLPWSASAPRLSIVVLPFQDLSDGPDGWHLADAVTGDLTTDLSRVWDLLVVPRDVAAGYPEMPADAKQIGRERDVRFLLEGSIQRLSDVAQVNYRLVDAEHGEQLMADRFHADTANVAKMQNEISSRIARTLYFTLAQIERRRIELIPPGDRGGRDLTMLGWAELNSAHANLMDVKHLFERALELDPQSVNARLGLAKVLIGQLTYPRTDAFLRTEARIEQLLDYALKSGRDRAQTYATIGTLRRVENRFVESRIELEMAIELDPSNSWAYYQLGVTLMYLGQPNAGVGYIEKAIYLNPSHPNVGYYYWGLGACQLLLRHTDEAVELLRKARAANPQPYYIHEWLAGALALKGDLNGARTALAAMLRTEPELTSLEAIRNHFPWSTNAEHVALREQTIDLGLREAGLLDH